ncbi:hypothetical protein Tcan_12455 [Toxocara canis]|uniref:Uncharacterized protein n=1 Tax=Toxocara canis TaxID=6265 RepID=A0A0B2VEB8_TOXCA|nr:hypothetical protein Tcan_12455 [Toxocara canis]
MEKRARMQNVLPVYAERGAARIVAEKKANARSIPFIDGEFSQWYRVGNLQRGGFWRPYTLTAVVLECVLMLVSLLFIAHTLFNTNVKANSDWAATIVHVFDSHILYPHAWFTWLLLPAAISAIVFPLLAIMFISGEERRVLKWVTFTMHLLSALALMPLIAEAFIMEFDFRLRGTYWFVQRDFDQKSHVEEARYVLKWWALYASFYERRFMHFHSEETLIRSLEQKIHCCGIESSNEYWKPEDYTESGLADSFPSFEPGPFMRYIQTDWAKAAYKATKHFHVYPQSCCASCIVNSTRFNISTLTWRPKTMRMLKRALSNVMIDGSTCRSKMKDLHRTHLYPLYGYTTSMFFLNVVLCVFVGMRNFCKWVTEGVDEEKYIEEIKEGKTFRDKLRDRRRVLNEGSNAIYNTAIRVDSSRNRLAIQTQITQYVPTRKTKRRRKRWKRKF